MLRPGSSEGRVLVTQDGPVAGWSDAPASDGSVLTSDTTQTGGVRWENHGIVSSLPASPVDGQMCYFQTSSMATDGIVWHLKYRAGSGSSYKWEFVGGSKWLKEVSTQETTASTSYANLATTGPTVTAPLAGEYVVFLSAEMWDFTSPATVWMSYSVGAAAAVDADAIEISPNGGETAGAFHVTREKIKTLAASDALTAKYKVNAGTGSFRYRVIAIIPIRVG
jgi:hypothetical protein